MSCFQEELIQASVRQLSSIGQEIGRFCSVYHAHEAVHSHASEADRRMAQDIKDAALAAFERFISSPDYQNMPETLKAHCTELEQHVTSWKAGDIPLSELMKSMNRTAGISAMQANVTLCELFISVHNIFSLLQLKQLQMQATSAIAYASSR